MSDGTNQQYVGMTHQVVTYILSPIYEKGHIAYMDNYFSSPALFDELREYETGACGTLRLNSRGVPESIKQAKTNKSGEYVMEQSDSKLFIAWHDKRQVNLLSTVHNDHV